MTVWDFCEHCRRNGFDRINKHRRECELALEGGIPSRKLRREIATNGTLRVAVVLPWAPLSERRHAQALGGLAMREMHYDCGVYNATESHVDRTHAFIATEAQNSIGIAFVGLHRGLWIAQWTDPPGTPATRVSEDDQGWMIQFAWVVKGRRRSGVARALVLAAAQFFEMPPEEFAWQTPFSDGGRALVRRVSPKGIRIR